MLMGFRDGRRAGRWGEAGRLPVLFPLPRVSYDHLVPQPFHLTHSQQAVSDWAPRPLPQGLGSSDTTRSPPHPSSSAQSIHGEPTASGSQAALPTQAQPQPQTQTQCPEQEPCLSLLGRQPGELPQPRVPGRVGRAVEGSPEAGSHLPESRGPGCPLSRVRQSSCGPGLPRVYSRGSHQAGSPQPVGSELVGIPLSSSVGQPFGVSSWVVPERSEPSAKSVCPLLLISFTVCFPCPRSVLGRVTSQVNSLHPNPCLSIASGEPSCSVHPAGHPQARGRGCGVSSKASGLQCSCCCLSLPWAALPTSSRGWGKSGPSTRCCLLYR